MVFTYSKGFGQSRVLLLIHGLDRFFLFMCRTLNRGQLDLNSIACIHMFTHSWIVLPNTAKFETGG